MNRFVALALILAFAACNAPATHPLDPAPGAHPVSVAAPRDDAPASFFPADYEGEVFIDVAAMRRTRLLDAIERIPMADGFLAAIAEGFGIDIDDVERVRTAVVYDALGPRATTHTVSVVDVGDSRAGVLPPDWTEARIGAYEAWQRHDGRASVPTLVRPRPGIVVLGGHDLLEPVLSREVRGGRPHADLMPLLAGRGVLLQYAFGCFGRPVSAHLGTIGFPHSWTDTDDPIEFVRIRLAEVERELVLSLTLRFAHGTSGAEKVEQALAGVQAMVADQRRLAMLEPITSRILVARDGNDLTASLALGTPREAIGELERAVLAMMRAAAESHDD